MFTLQLLPSLTAEVRADGTVIKRPSTLEEKIACERIMKEISVLEEQYEQVRVFLVDATSRRRFEDAQMLKDSLDELAFEITLKRKELETVGQR